MGLMCRVQLPGSSARRPFFDVFVFPVTSVEGLTIRWSMGIEHSRSKGPPQKPLAATSSLAPSSVMAEAPESASPVMGCSVGSMDTLLQTSEMRLAVRSLISLCRMVGNPPLGQDRACSTEKLVPHVPVVGVCWGSQPYLRAMASLKAPFVERKTKLF